MIFIRYWCFSRGTSDGWCFTVSKICFQSLQWDVHVFSSLYILILLIVIYVTSRHNFLTQTFLFGFSTSPTIESPFLKEKVCMRTFPRTFRKFIYVTHPYRPPMKKVDIARSICYQVSWQGNNLYRTVVHWYLTQVIYFQMFPYVVRNQTP